jgi:hypothetical protein
VKIDEMKNIVWLVENGGDLSIGSIGPIPCAAVASDEDSMLAAAVKRPGESLTELLLRVDAAIDKALNDQEYLDEINR